MGCFCNSVISEKLGSNNMSCQVILVVKVCVSIWGKLSMIGVVKLVVRPIQPNQLGENVKSRLDWTNSIVYRVVFFVTQHNLKHWTSGATWSTTIFNKWKHKNVQKKIKNELNLAHGRCPNNSILFRDLYLASSAQSKHSAIEAGHLGRLLGLGQNWIL